MRSNPLVGAWISLGVAAVAVGWLLLQWLAGDALFAAFGYTMHAITLLAVFALIAGLAVALLLRRFARVRADLLSGRNVIARWTVAEAEFEVFAARAVAADRDDKRGALALVVGLVVLIFGAFALFDPEVAPAMLGMAGLVALLMAAAYFLGGWVMRRQLQSASREVIVGTDGLMLNGVLHVWSAVLTWLAGVDLDPGPPGTLAVTYAYLARFGPQYVTVALPVPRSALPLARQVVERLSTRRAGRSSGVRS